MLRIALGMLGLTQVRHVRPVRRGAARGTVREVYRQLERDFGVIGPPVALHASSPDNLAAAWMLVRETLVAQGKAPQAMREAVATAVSRSNECPYCVAIHHDATLAHGGSPIVDTTRALPPALLPELGGVAVMMHYLNRMVNVFLLPLPLPPAVPAFMLRPVMKVLGPVMRSAHNDTPGASLALLPDAPLPPELAWIAPSPTLAAAFAKATAAIDRAGLRCAPSATRDLLFSFLGTWHGQPMGLTRTWSDEAVATLPPHERPVAKLALLTAVASYQIDDSVVLPVQQAGYDDRSLVELVAWAGMSAARRIATWIPDHIAPPSPPATPPTAPTTPRTIG